MSQLREEREGAPLADVQLTACVHGYVQGVGFRWWTRSRALELGLNGYASNKPDGRVEVVAQGSREACERMLELLQSGNTPGRVHKVVAEWSDATEPFRGFSAR